jgi:hypothetical protein
MPPEHTPSRPPPVAMSAPCMSGGRKRPFVSTKRQGRAPRDWVGGSGKVVRSARFLSRTLGRTRLWRCNADVSADGLPGEEAQRGVRRAGHHPELTFP